MRTIDAEKFESRMKEYFTRLIKKNVHEVNVVNCSADLMKLLEDQETVPEEKSIFSSRVTNHIMSRFMKQE